MAEDPSNHLTYVLEIAQQHQAYLGQIRHWSNLKIALDAETYWIKDLTQNQIASVEIKSIPFKHIYSLKEYKLFPVGSHLPLKKMPSSLLWTPIERGLPVTLPSFNHNYFGIQEKIEIQISLSAAEKEPFAMITSLDKLKKYIETASAIRLKNLTWTILEDSKALILGTPLLPIQGDTFWKDDDFLMPTGFDFDINILTTVIKQKIFTENEAWIIWNKESSYFSIEKSYFQPLSISSFRLSIMV